MTNKRNINKSKTKEEQRLVAISSDNNLEYYFDPSIIPNQNLIREIYDYFDTGAGSRVFKPLVLLNLLDKQYRFVLDNHENAELVSSSVTDLPLKELEMHILLGLILKRFGGYPVHNLNEQLDATLKLLQKKFLAFEGDTPEKEFCKVDTQMRNQFTKLGIALTTSINHNIDVRDILDAMPDKKPAPKTYNDFDQMFKDAYKAGLLGNFGSNDQVYLIERSRHEFQFSVWLQDKKGLEYGNHLQYTSLLTESIFNEYLKDEAADSKRDIFLNSLTGDEGFKVYHESYSKLRAKFRVKRIATKQDCISCPRFKEGDILEFDPDYKTSIEAFTLLTKYYAVAYLELEKHFFVEKYKVWNEQTTRAEINELDNFINEAKKLSLSEACSMYGKWEGNKWEYIYLRFTGGFYENLEINKYPSINTIGNDEARVYGKYFLLYDLLKVTLDSITPSEVKIEKPKNSSSRSKLDFTKDRLKITVNELANLNGYESPSTYLDVLLDDVRQFEDFEFECNFFLNIHYLCNEHSANFWSESHRKDITKWLKKAPLTTNAFESTWENVPKENVLTESMESKLSIKTYALLHVYLAKFGGQAITQQNKNELAIKYGHTSGVQLRNDFVYFQDDAHRLDLSNSNRKSAKTTIGRFNDILPLLKDTDLSAYSAAQNDLESLQRKYDTHFI